MQISGHRHIASINNYRYFNESHHKMFSSIIPSTDSSQNIAQNQVTRTSQSDSTNENATSSSNIHVTGEFQGSFDGTIHGGNFQVHIHQSTSPENTNSPARKCIRLTASDWLNICHLWRRNTLDLHTSRDWLSKMTSSAPRTCWCLFIRLQRLETVKRHLFYFVFSFLFYYLVFYAMKRKY